MRSRLTRSRVEFWLPMGGALLTSTGVALWLFS